MKFRKLGALAGASLLVLAACSSTPSASTPAGGSGGTGGLTPTTPKPAGDSSKGTVKIAIELPQQGSEKAASKTTGSTNGTRTSVEAAMLARSV